MSDKDYKRHLAHDALMILIALAIFLFICRLWPILPRDFYRRFASGLFSQHKGRSH